MKFIIYFILFIPCIFILKFPLWYITYNNKIESQYFLIYLSSCNRFNYLNATINSIVNHMKNYESLSYHILLFDQGTVEVYNSFNIRDKEIYNIFYMNPNGYTYTYNLIFSHLYSKYALLIDDDRPIRENIEKYLKFTNFISISLSIMDENEDIYGIILKSEGDGKVKCYNHSIYHKTIRYCKVERAFYGYYYSNGASVYRTNELKRVEIYTEEADLANYFGRTKYRMAYLLLNNECKNVSNLCNYVIDHIGVNSTLVNNICNIYLY